MRLRGPRCPPLPRLGLVLASCTSCAAYSAWFPGVPVRTPPHSCGAIALCHNQSWAASGFPFGGPSPRAGATRRKQSLQLRRLPQYRSLIGPGGPFFFLILSALQARMRAVSLLIFYFLISFRHLQKCWGQIIRKDRHECRYGLS
jgi:hypothetical protein